MAVLTVEYIPFLAVVWAAPNHDFSDFIFTSSLLSPPQAFHANLLLHLLFPPPDCHTAHFLNSNVTSLEGLL